MQGGYAPRTWEPNICPGPYPGGASKFAVYCSAISLFFGKTLLSLSIPNAPRAQNAEGGFAPGALATARAFGALRPELYVGGIEMQLGRTPRALKLGTRKTWTSVPTAHRKWGHAPRAA